MSIIEQAKAAGFSEVQSYTGWTALESWEPYGEKPDANKYVRFVLDIESKRINEEPQGILLQLKTAQAFGSWPVR